MPYIPNRPFWYPWNNLVLTQVYDDSLSYIEQLQKMIAYFNQLGQNENFLYSMAQSLEVDVTQLQQDMAGIEERLTNELNSYKAVIEAQAKELETTIQQIQNGDYLDLYLPPVKQWVDENVQNFVAEIVKYVQFGLSDDGHFVAYIPDSWDFLNFTTITDTSSDLYGHLVMYY